MTFFDSGTADPPTDKKTIDEDEFFATCAFRRLCVESLALCRMVRRQ